MSKKTPKSEKAKTRLGRKQLSVYRLLFLVLLIILGFAWLSLRSEKSGENIEPAVPCVQIEQECFELEVADTDREHGKGLSNRDSLPEGSGLLFVFGQVEEQCFWMKDMKFSLDIIWLDEKKKIVKIKENVSPDTYPDSFCADNTKYVLEFNHGFAAKHGLKPGTTLQFR